MDIIKLANSTNLKYSQVILTLVSNFHRIALEIAGLSNFHGPLN